MKAAMSLRQRLLVQLIVVAALLSVILYLAVRSVADEAAEATQDNILGASVATIAEQMGVADGGLVVDIPYSAFSMLGAVSEERVFYRILQNDETITGYEDLPLPGAWPTTVDSPIYYSSDYLDTHLRIAAIEKRMSIGSQSVSARVVIGQTRLGQETIAARVASRAAIAGVGLFLLAALLSWLAINTALRPLQRVIEAVGRRGPHDLRVMNYPVPSEFNPLLDALNSFMARLKSARERTETFIAEAAHHVRTPLATVRTQTEIAMHHADSEQGRHALREVIRSVDESSRSAGQLLEHAMVNYRVDQPELVPLDLAAIVTQSVDRFDVAAELKEIDISLAIDTPLSANGDRVLLESAIMNIIDNAIKYSPSDTTVKVCMHQESNNVCVSVLDEGRGLSGMSDEELTLRFQRGGNVNDVVGSGLGLSIVKEVAKVHNGRFTLSARTNSGTKACLCLPMTDL